MLVKPLNGNQLKLIAVISMLIDHTGFALMQSSPYYDLFRGIGRLAFPIYCFLLVEGFSYTRDWKRYAMRLGVFALLSEIPFNFILSGRIICIQGQNVYFSLFLGVLLLVGLRKYEDQLWKQVAMIIGMSLVITWLRVDYTYEGVLLIALFYYFRRYDPAWLFCYNGLRGSNRYQYWFYWFYPIHLLVLALLREWIK